MPNCGSDICTNVGPSWPKHQPEARKKTRAESSLRIRIAPQGKLENPGIGGAADFAERRRAGDARSGGVEMRCIQHVEEVRAKLRAEPLGDRKRLGEGPVE